MPMIHEEFVEVTASYLVVARASLPAALEWYAYQSSCTPLIVRVS